MGTLILGIITAIIAPSATLIGVWLGSKSSLTAQRELLVAQELQGQRELIVDVIVPARQYLDQQVFTLPLVAQMNEKDMLEWVDTDSAVEMRATKKELNRAISRATHSLNNQGLSLAVADLGDKLSLDDETLKDGEGGKFGSDPERVFRWYFKNKGRITSLEALAWKTLRPPQWLTPESLQGEKEPKREGKSSGQVR